MVTEEEIERTLANNIWYGVSHAVGVLEYNPSMFINNQGCNDTSLNDLFDRAAQKAIEVTAAQLEPEIEDITQSADFYQDYTATETPTAETYYGSSSYSAY